MKKPLSIDMSALLYSVPKTPTDDEPSLPVAEPQPTPTADVQTGEGVVPVNQARSGSLLKPYVRKDGQRTVHVTFSLPDDLAKEIRVFVSRLPPGARNDWAAHWLSHGMGQTWPARKT